MITISSASPSIVSQRGGVVVTLTGVFIIGNLYRIYFGPTADASGTPCLSALAGHGFNCQSLDGTHLSFLMPPLPNGRSYSPLFFITDGSDTYWGHPITVTEESFSGISFPFKRSTPPWYGVGSRHLEDEPLRALSGVIETSTPLHPITPDCLGCWRMDETLASSNAIDSSSYANHGIVTTNNPPCVVGKTGNARDMRYYIPPPAYYRSFNVPYHDRYRTPIFTVAAWVMWNGMAGIDMPVVVYALPYVPEGYAIRLGATNTGFPQFEILFNDPTFWQTLTHSAAFTAGVWQHLGGVWDGTYMRLFLDGIEVATSASLAGKTINFGLNPYGPSLGGGNLLERGGHGFFRGYVDDIVLYSSAKDSVWMQTYSASH